MKRRTVRRISRTQRAHGDIALIAALFTLAMTLSTIVNVFRRDGFWLPTLAKLDIFNHLWDMWYGGLLLGGQESRFYTDMMFNPDGVSLARHPLFLPQILAVRAFMLFLPLWNAFNLSCLLFIWTTIICAYVYAYYLFKDKWLALLAGLVAGCCPNALGESADRRGGCHWRSKPGRL